MLQIFIRKSCCSKRQSRSQVYFSVDASLRKCVCWYNANATVASGEITVDMGGPSLVLTKYDTANIDYSQAITVMFGLKVKHKVEVFQVVTFHYPA